MTRRMLITGGAGFIGTNAATYFARRGWEVSILDNLSRAGAADNLAWLRARANIGFERVDVRHKDAVMQMVRAHGPLDAVLHLAAQVAVTTSVRDPRMDFEVNALGTLNVLEAVRHHCPKAVFVNASTNKVYGNMEDIAVQSDGDAYCYVDLPFGIPESRRVDFHSPYGCSKGAAEQYVLDYGRIFGLRTVSFRQSCIYGPRQFGVEDQGWVAWFVIAAILGEPITIYGDGHQVRDLLHVADLLRAYEFAILYAERISGRPFNIGGGMENTVSILGLLRLVEEMVGTSVPIHFVEWRPGDQRVYVSDIRAAAEALGWRPETEVPTGVEALVGWVGANRALVQRALS